MPIRLTDLQRDEREFEFEFNGETMQVTYQPSAYTPATEDEMQAAFESGRPANGLARILSHVILDWELMDGEERLPVEIAVLTRLPNEFLVALSNAVVADQQEDRDTLKNSGGGSLRKGKSGNARGGTR